MEDNLNGRQPLWKTTSMEDNLMEDNLNGRQPQWNTTSMEEQISMEDNLQWKKTLKKPYRKMTLACIASQFCTELGPAQPQLVYNIYYSTVVHVVMQSKKPTKKGSFFEQILF